VLYCVYSERHFRHLEGLYEKNRSGFGFDFDVREVYRTLRAGYLNFSRLSQVADGLLPDGSAYYSSLFTANVGTNAATCTIRLYGPVSNRITGSLTIVIAPSGGIVVKNTSLTDGILSPIATGYGTLTCDRPVAAQAGYFYVAPGLPNFRLLGAATVFSTPATTRAELILTTEVGFRMAVAIANNTDAAAQYQVTVLNDSFQTVGTTTVAVPARSNIAKFVDELVNLPANFDGAAFIDSSTPFSAIGLLYNGTTFLTVPAVPFTP
jgi:hypothetical protein